MKLFLLDTNIVSFALRGHAPAVPARLAKMERSMVGVSVITLMELRYGASLPGRALRYQEVIDHFERSMPVYPLTGAVAKAYGHLRASLRTAGTPIGALDTIIAAHALSLDATLVTNNQSEFQSVSGLRIEDWTEA